MSHLESRISDLVDARLGAAETESAHAHLAGCGTCREMVEAERLTKARLSALDVPAPSGDFMARLLAVPALVAADPVGAVDLADPVGAVADDQALADTSSDGSGQLITVGPATTTRVVGPGRPAPWDPAARPDAGPAGSRRPGSSPRPTGTPDPAAASVRPALGRRRAQLARRPGRTRFAATVAGSMGVLGAGVFALSVVSPSVNATMAPKANLSMARTVITMTGLPIVNALPGRWLGGTAPGR